MMVADKCPIGSIGPNRLNRPNRPNKKIGTPEKEAPREHQESESGLRGLKGKHSLTLQHPLDPPTL